jgi:hypothetical protein
VVGVAVAVDGGDQKARQQTIANSTFGGYKETAYWIVDMLSAGSGHAAQAIHEKLGGTVIIDDTVFKPKGMHWRTFNRKTARLREAESRAVPPWLLRALRGRVQ